MALLRQSWPLNSWNGSTDLQGFCRWFGSELIDTLHFHLCWVSGILNHLYKSLWCDQTLLWLFYCCSHIIPQHNGNPSLIKVIRALSLILNWIRLFALSLQSFIGEVSLEIQMAKACSKTQVIKILWPSEWSGSYFMLFSPCVSIQTPCWMSAWCWEEKRSSCHGQGHLWFYRIT